MQSDETGGSAPPDVTAHGHPSPVPIDALLADDPDLFHRSWIEGWTS